MPKTNRKAKTIEKATFRMTQWVGTPQSLILHTILFGGAFLLIFLGINFDAVLLILTTIVSLEAIYLAIFIQMSVNRNTKSLEEVEADIDEIQEDVEGLEDDVEEISEDLEEIQEDDKEEKENRQTLGKIEKELQHLLAEVRTLQKNGHTQKHV